MENTTSKTILAEVFAQLGALEREQERLGEGLARLQEGLAVVEARVFPENRHHTVMGWAETRGEALSLGAASGLAKLCAELSRERGMPIGHVSDPCLGKMCAYHEDVLRAVFSESGRGW